MVQWFDLGGALRLEESSGSAAIVEQLGRIQGLLELTGALGAGKKASEAVRASAGEFILEGLYAHRRISRSEELGFVADPKRREAAATGETAPPGARRRFQ